jgi:hypothetical protein
VAVTESRVELTIFRRADGPLTKRISLSSDGSIKSDGSECVMGRGTARRFMSDRMEGCADLIGRLSSDEALALGTLRSDLPEEVEVVCKKYLNGVTRPNLIARTQDYIVYRPGELALVLLDFDAKGMPPVVADQLAEKGGFWSALVKIIPEFARIARVERASTSAGLYDKRTGKTFPGSEGRHVYLLVKDGTDNERFLKALHERCWLAGLGWKMVGASGQLLERSIVDRVCGTPERLVFEGRPVLVSPVAQNDAARKPVAVEGDPLDTIAVCPSLIVAELAKLRELREKENDRLAGESARVRETFVERQSRRLVDRTDMDLRTARKIIERQCDGVLLPNIELLFDDPQFTGKTVADVLANPAEFEGATLPDPLEGVEYGRCKARVMRRADGSMWINSFAHGWTTYELRLDFAAVKAVLEKTVPEDVVETLGRLVPIADLRDDEVEILRNLANKISGIGKRTLDRKLKKLRHGDPDGEPHADLIEAFNAQYAVVSEAGKAMIYQRVRDPMLGRYVIVRSRFDDFRRFYQNQSIELVSADGVLKTKATGDFWLDHPKRRQYLGGVVFDPTGKAASDYWNLWSGFDREPRAGDWSLMHDHVFKIICARNPTYCDFLLNTAARMFQHPNYPPKSRLSCAARKAPAKVFSASISSRRGGSTAPTSQTRNT